MEKYNLVSDGNMLLIDPWIHALGKECVFYRTSYDPFSSATKRVKEEMYHVQRLNGREVGYVADGLSDKVLKWFNDRGIPYQFEDKRYWKVLPVPHWDRVDFEKVWARDGQEDILSTIATNYNGVIDAATGFGKSFIIVQICKMYPKLNIVIVTARKSVVKTIYERLQEAGLDSETGIMISGRNTGPDHRIIVTTTKSMEKTNCDKCDLLLFDECHALAAPGTAYKIALFGRARKFGFSASPLGRGDKSDMALEALLGPIRYSLTYQQAVASGSVVPIDVHMYDMKTGPRVWGNRHLALKRKGIWQNEQRNKKIAEVAKSFGPRQVLIMVETVEHLMNIKRFLPEYEIAYASCTKERYQEYVDKGWVTGPMLSDEDVDDIQDRFETGELRHLISTFIFREGVDFVNLSAMLRADGQAGPIAATQIPGRLSRKIEGKDKAVLVDFYDSFNPILENCSKARLKIYNEKGWHIEYKDRL